VAQSEHQDQPEPEEPQDWTDKPVSTEPTERPEMPERTEVQEVLELLVQPADPEHRADKVFEEPVVSVVPQEMLEVLDQQEEVEPQDQLE